MPIKVYLSEANQLHNVGPEGYNEKEGMVAIVKALYSLLRKDSRFEVKRCSFLGVDTAKRNIAAANAWGADRYIALHSNAGGVSARGTKSFYYSSSSKGKAMAKALLDEVAPLSPGTTDSMSPHDSFMEVNGPNAPAVLLEIEAHDWLAGVKFLRHYNIIARALYKGICKGCGLTPDVNVYDPFITKAVTLRRSQWSAMKQAVAARGGTVK